MRERMSRGKRTDNDEGEFVYGIPVEGEPLLGMGKRTYIITKPGVQWVDGVYMTYDECIEVDPNTVGQFTGLYDKNGRKIFEGDILKIAKAMDGMGGYYDPPLDYPVIVVVKWDLCSWLWETLNCKPKRYISFPEAWCHFVCEVIGNIFDSTELLEAATGEDVGNAAQGALLTAT